MVALLVVVAVALLLWRLRPARPTRAPPAILIVEDDPAQAYVLKEHLKLPQRVLLAHTLTEAEVLLHRERFDLLFLDLLLPEGSSVDLAVRVRHGRYTTSSTTPIILLTGLSLQADELLRVTQANACFFKPVDFPELCKTAQELLRESRPN